MTLANPAPRPTVAFGSCQERKVFPVYFPPNRLGNHMTRQDAPHRGPGCYDNHKFCSMTHDLESRPISKRGYSARTGPRFLPSNKTVTPSPQMYQQDQAQSTMAAPPAKTPFNSTTFRFTNNTESTNTNPGKVAWPMSFGTPDWSRIPQLKKRTLRAELNSDKDFKKQRANMAYLSLYYGNNNGVKRS